MLEQRGIKRGLFMFMKRKYDSLGPNINKIIFIIIRNL